MDARLVPSGQCLNCYDINFGAYFSLSLDHLPAPSILIEDAMLSADICPFCNLIVSVARQFTPNEIVVYQEWEREFS
jgi:hypothetical protein